jgi:16S rRNA processing protein RimM
MAVAADNSGDFIVVGRVSGLHGVRGWIKVYSHTQPRDNILGYSTWYLKRQGEWQAMELQEGRPHGKGILAHLTGIDDRDLAASLVGSDIAIRREQLAGTAEDEYYWADLIGLNVVTKEGIELGMVDSLFETGANDVLVVRGERERLIPFLPEQVIIEIDLSEGRMVVDWDPEF